MAGQIARSITSTTYNQPTRKTAFKPELTQFIKAPTTENAKNLLGPGSPYQKQPNAMLLIRTLLKHASTQENTTDVFSAIKILAELSDLHTLNETALTKLTVARTGDKKVSGDVQEKFKETIAKIKNEKEIEKQTKETTELFDTIKEEIDTLKALKSEKGTEKAQKILMLSLESSANRLATWIENGTETKDFKKADAAKILEEALSSGLEAHLKRLNHIQNFVDPNIEPPQSNTHLSSAGKALLKLYIAVAPRTQDVYKKLTEAYPRKNISLQSAYNWARHVERSMEMNTQEILKQYTSEEIALINWLKSSSNGVEA